MINFEGKQLQNNLAFAAWKLKPEKSPDIESKKINYFKRLRILLGFTIYVVFSYANLDIRRSFCCGGTGKQDLH